jgi:hypothetical protein
LIVGSNRFYAEQAAWIPFPAAQLKQVLRRETFEDRNIGRFDLGLAPDQIFIAWGRLPGRLLLRLALWRIRGHWLVRVGGGGRLPNWLDARVGGGKVPRGYKLEMTISPVWISRSNSCPGWRRPSIRAALSGSATVFETSR